VNVSNTRITNITYVTNTYYNVNVNTVHITNIHYVNQSVPGGMTVVNNEVIVNSRPVNHNVYIGHDDDWRDHHDRWVAAAPACAPSHDSVLGVHAGERARIPERINQRPVVVKMTPPPARAPFEPRRGDNGRPWNRDDHRADGDMPNPQHGNDDASNRGYAHGNDADHGRNGNDENRRDPVADRGRDFPHPGRGHDDDRGQQNANDGHDQNGHDQNAHNGNNGDHDDRGRKGRPDWAGVPHEGSSDSPRYPRPPRSWDGDHSQPSSAGNNQPGNSGQQNGNGDQNQNAHDGNGNSNDNGNNGRRGRPDWAGVPHEGASGSHGPNSSNNDGSQASSAGNNQPGNSGQHNGNSGQNQNAQSGNGNSGRRGRPDWAGVPHEGALGSPNYPRPPRPAGPSSNDNSQPSSAGNNQPGQGQGSQASDDRGNRGGVDGNRPNWNNGQGQNANNSNGGNGQQAQGPAWSRPNQDGNWGNRQVPRPPAQPASNGQGNGMSSGMERPSQPVYQAPAASQQTERDIPRPREGVTNRPQPVMQQPQTENQQRDYPTPQRQMRQPSYSAPSAPAQQAQRPVLADPRNSRSAQVVERAAQPQSRPTPSRDSGASENSHGASSFQGRDHGKVQDK
jgi:hypothetical protein